MSDSEDKSVVQSIRDNFESLFMDRLSSPLIFSFLISWCLSNYKVFLIIMSGNKFTYKVDLLNWYFYSPSYYWVIHGFLFPAIAAYLYVYQWPKINIKVIEHTLNNKIKENELRNRISQNEVRTVEEVNRIHARHSREVRGLKQEIERLQYIETQLTAELEIQGEMNSNNVEFPGPLTESEAQAFDESNHLENKQLTNSEITIINMLGESENSGRNSVPFIDLSRAINADRVKTRVMISELAEKRLIIYGNGNQFSLAPLGQKLFLELKENFSSTNLTETGAELLYPNSPLSSENHSPRFVLTPSQNEVLNYVASVENLGKTTFINEDDLVNDISKYSAIEIRHALSKLVEKKLLYFWAESLNYQLTPPGREFLLSQGKSA